MTDTTQNAPEAEASKRQIAKREWINKGGEKLPTGSPDVAGVRYTFISTGKSVEFMLGDDNLSRQFAAMGAVTKIGNVVNSIVNAEDYDNSDPMPAVEEWLTNAINGEWREPAEAGTARGPKYDKGVLAAALHAELGAKATGDVASYLTRLEDRSYYAKVRNNPKVMSRYMQEMASKGEATASADSLA